MVAAPSTSLAMQVPQLPASQLNGGDRPARRALSSSVSPATRGTVAFLRSSLIVTVPPCSAALPATAGAGVVTVGDASKSSTRTVAPSGSADRTTVMNPSGPQTKLTSMLYALLNCST